LSLLVGRWRWLLTPSRYRLARSTWAGRVLVQLRSAGTVTLPGLNRGRLRFGVVRRRTLPGCVTCTGAGVCGLWPVR
jgi:hypothetical protein